jgi:hypothetical protein
MKIAEYKNIEDYDMQKLDQLVNEAIQEGWQPLGSVVVYILPSNKEPWYVQTMVKE